MSKRSANSNQRATWFRGFTLVELLVVITIIALLAGLLLPVIIGAIKKAEIAKAQGEIKALEKAVQGYFNEYGRFPGQTTASGNTPYSGANYTKLIAVLTSNINSAPWVNPKNIMFLDVDSHSMTNGNLVDPWGKNYNVIADWSFKNTINNADGFQVGGHPVVVWSYGPKGITTPKDPTHLWSWQ